MLVLRGQPMRPLLGIVVFCLVQSGLGLLGAAVAQDSLNTRVVGHLDNYGAYSDIWGYTTQDGRELAILGTQNGTSIVDVTNPGAAQEIAFIAGPSSVWRDMKTHAGYGYVVTEGGGGGMLIVDLEANPPDSITTYAINFDTAHNIAIADGYAYIIGARQSNTFAGTRIVSLANPTSPVEVGSFTQFYIHDCVVRDDMMYASAINNDFQAIVDVSNKAAPVVVASWSWAGNNAHSCDLSTDGRYILTTDEVTGGRLRIFDISNLNDIRQVASYTPNSAAIIHNVYVRGDLAFISFYTEGLRILDITAPENPVEVGYYDTFPGASGGFNGAWGAYPYTPSGRIYVSDIQSGLFVVEFDLAWGAAQGIVRESGGGAPLEGAQVELVGGISTQTNPAGIYKLYADPGVFWVRASTFGFFADSLQVTLTAGDVTPADFELQRLPNSPISGTLTHALTALPLGDASLHLENTPFFQQSDANGDYLFDHVPYGVYKLQVSRFGFAAQSRTVSVTSSNPLIPLRFDFALTPAALVETFEAGPAGWTGGSGGDTATSGQWIWADPVGSASGTVQPEDDHSVPGDLCWVTGNAPSATSGVGTADVDDGWTTLLTPLFDLSGLTNPAVSYWRWFSNDAGTPAAPDTLRVDITNNAGLDWVPVERLTTSVAAWTEVVVRVSDYVTPTSLMRVRFVAEDVGVGSIVECAIDDFMAYEDLNVTDAPRGALLTRLQPSFPNPFNPSTQLRFELAQAAHVELAIYDVRGRLVRSLANGRLPGGAHSRRWDGQDASGRPVASGVYLARLVTADYRGAERLVLVR